MLRLVYLTNTLLKVYLSFYSFKNLQKYLQTTAITMIIVQIAMVLTNRPDTQMIDFLVLVKTS